MSTRGDEEEEDAPDEEDEEEEDEEEAVPKRGEVQFFHGKKRRGKCLDWMPSKEFGPFSVIKKHSAKHPNKALKNTVDINASRQATATDRGEIRRRREGYLLQADASVQGGGSISVDPQGGQGFAGGSACSAASAL